MSSLNTESDPGLQPAHVYLHEFPRDLPPRNFQGIPGISASRAGTLFATWYGGGAGENADNYVLVTHRDPRTRIWREPWLVVQPRHPQVRAFDPTLWLDAQHRLWLFWAQVHCKPENNSPDLVSKKPGAPDTRTTWDGRAGVWGICCEQPDSQPDRWNEPVRFCDGIMMNKPTLDARGNWLMPVSMWDLLPNHPQVPLTHRGPTVAISSDQGRSAQFQSFAVMPDWIFDEHHIVPLRDGRWALWARSMNLQRRATVSYSSDSGRTWTPGQFCDIPCPNSRFFVGRLNSGALLLVSHQISDEVRSQTALWPTRSHLAAWVSDDDGVTWQGNLLLDERKGVSYPDAVQTDDGAIHVTYDFDRHGAKQILVSTITEAQIRAGGRAPQAEIVNQVR